MLSGVCKYNPFYTKGMLTYIYVTKVARHTNVASFHHYFNLFPKREVRGGNV